MIIILESVINNDMNTGLPASRGTTIYITDNVTAYVMQVGNLALVGNLHTILNAMETDLWALVQINGTLATATDSAIVEAIQVYIANPGMKADVFDKSIAQETTDITALVAASFPLASVAVKTGWFRLLMSSLLDTRVNAHDRGLV